MHELSIALNIVSIATDEAKKNNCSQVKILELEVGALAGIELEALDLAWQEAIKGTTLQEAKLKVKETKGKALCLDCQKPFHIQQLYDCCPICNGFRKQLLKGKEIRIHNLTMI